MKKNLLFVLMLLLVSCDDDIRWEHNKSFTIMSINGETAPSRDKFRRPTFYKMMLLRSNEDTTKYLEFNVDNMINGDHLYYTKKVGDTLTIPELYAPQYFKINN